MLHMCPAGELGDDAPVLLMDGLSGDVVRQYLPVPAHRRARLVTGGFYRQDGYAHGRKGTNDWLFSTKTRHIPGFLLTIKELLDVFFAKKVARFRNFVPNEVYADGIKCKRYFIAG
jgi:hypothetical protein